MIVLNPVESQAESRPSSSAPERDDSRWDRRGLWVLLSSTAVLYLWGLGGSGWANEYYAAAAQAGTQSWKALLFGSLDSGNAITVDKPPASLWLMSLSGRIFGFSSWSMLVPQALMGVATVALVYAAVRRISGPGAGLLAGTAMALTPVAALMFRFNNPDALLVLLLVVAAYCVIRALDSAPAGWVALAGVALGFAFLAKLLQALLIAPGLALVILVALPGGLWRRIRVLAVGLITTVISGGWYVALISLWPSDSRPYIGGSNDNSLLELTLGYNGLGRVFGGQGNPGGSGAQMPAMPPDPGHLPGGPGGGGFGGSPSPTRLFGQSMGTEISWLLPAALICLAMCVWYLRREPRTDRTRGALMLWSGWLVVTAVVFSFMKGIMHPYYTVALAPAIAATVGTGITELWRRRHLASARLALAVTLAATSGWSFVLLARTPDWLPWLRWVLIVGAATVALVLALRADRLGRWTAALAAAGLLLGLGGSAAYTVTTALMTHDGAIPTSGPHRTDVDFGPGHGGGPGSGGPRETDNPALNSLVGSAESRWAAATVGAHTAASLELATGTSVMAIGGFNGGDPSPTLQQFQVHVRQGDIDYFVVGKEPGGPGGPGPGGPDGPGDAMPGPGGPGGAGPGPRSGTEIAEWVKANFTAQEVGGTVVYDLGSGTSG